LLVRSPFCNSHASHAIFINSESCSQGHKQMSSPSESLKQQYATEVVKLDADEKLLRRLERGIRFLQEVAGPAGQCRAQNIPLQSF